MLAFWKLLRKPKVAESPVYAAAEPKRCGNRPCPLCDEDTRVAPTQPEPVDLDADVEARWRDAEALADSQDAYAHMVAAMSASRDAQAIGRSPMPFAPTQVPLPFVVFDDPEADLEAGVYP